MTPGVANQTRDNQARDQALLAVRALSRSFGGLRAVDEVDLDLAPASVTGLLGPNGSGKTTLFNLIDGTVRPVVGQAHGWAGAQARSRQPPGPRARWRGPYRSTAAPVPQPDRARERGPGRAAALPWPGCFSPRVTVAERARAVEVLADLGSHRGTRTPARPSLGYRQAQAHRTRPGALARPGARPARRAGRGHQPRPLAAARRHDPRAASGRRRRPARRARRRVPRQPVRPGLRHGQRQDHRQRHGPPRSARTGPSSTPTSATR